MNQNDCKGLFGKWFGHSFQGMYHIEKGEPTITYAPVHYEAYQVNMLIEASKSVKQTYLFSQCKRCGLKINET